jgi:hypothetical protein
MPSRADTWLGTSGDEAVTAPRSAAQNVVMPPSIVYSEPFT